MLSKDDIFAALAAVPGPDGKTPLNQSGAIYGVTIRDGKVFVAIRVNPARARELEGMRAAAEARIKALGGVASALVTLTAESAGAPAPGGGAAAIPIGVRPKRGRSPVSPRSSRSPPARAASASRPPPSISRSASPRWA